MASIALSTNAADIRSARASRANGSRKTTIALWVVQALLAALFLFAGSMKFIMPVAEMTKQIPFPGWFLHFIGSAEILGALGLILPSVLRIKPVLTPLAAAGLVIIMIGATVTTLYTPAPAGAVVPFVIALLAACVAYGRARVAPIGE
ncbi:MAG TPA: DoxX family protein [Gemmatimonadaceae bacterium]|nr:DoxX family protein [Gemmatimonadaceae bacterium]